MALHNLYNLVEYLKKEVDLVSYDKVRPTFKMSNLTCECDDCMELLLFLMCDCEVRVFKGKKRCKHLEQVLISNMNGINFEYLLRASGSPSTLVINKIFDKKVNNDAIQIRSKLNDASYELAQLQEKQDGKLEDTPSEVVDFVEEVIAATSSCSWCRGP